MPKCIAIKWRSTLKLPVFVIMVKPQRRCYATTLQRYNAATLQRCYATTLLRYDTATLRRYDAATLRRCYATTQCLTPPVLMLITTTKATASLAASVWCSSLVWQGHLQCQSSFETIAILLDRKSKLRHSPWDNVEQNRSYSLQPS